MLKTPAITGLLCCCVLSAPAFPQRMVRGTVSGGNELLTGATIALKEKKHVATTTDFYGRYALPVPDDGAEYTLQASYLGYVQQVQRLKTSQPDSIDFFLKEDAMNLDVVVVTATRTPKLLKNSPIITKVITENEIKKTDVTHIGELLQSELPGIEFSYTMGQQKSLNMQGFGGNAVLFLIDGERIAGETLDNADYSRINLDNAERVEIIKGAASSLYGSNAVGGVVNLISKKATAPWAININGRLASHNEQRYGGSMSFNKNGMSGTTSVQHTSEEGFELKNEGEYSAVYGSRVWNIRQNLRYEVNNRIKITGRAGYFFRERDSQETAKDRYRGFGGGIKGNYTTGKKSDAELAYSFDQYDKSDYYTVAKNDVRDYSNVQHSVRGLYNYSPDRNKILTLGGDYMRDYLMSYQFKDNESYRQYLADVFAQFDWTPFYRFNIITGLRYDYYSENNISRISPKAGVMYKVGRVSLRGSYAAGFRTPTLKEMYMSFDMASVFMIYGNPDLKSETSQNFSLSTEYTGESCNFSLTGYYNLVDNRITTAWSRELKGRAYVNMDHIKVAGLDANAVVKFSCGLSTRLSYVYTREKIKKGQPLTSQTRPHTATARVEYGKSLKHYRFNVALNGRFLSKKVADEYTSYTSYEETEKVTYPAYSLWKLSLTQNLRKAVSLTLAIDNLFNYVPSYYYSNSPYTTGTTFSAGISVDIDKLFR